MGTGEWTGESLSVEQLVHGKSLAGPSAPATSQAAARSAAMQAAQAAQDAIDRSAAFRETVALAAEESAKRQVGSGEPANFEIGLAEAGTPQSVSNQSAQDAYHYSCDQGEITRLGIWGFDRKGNLERIHTVPAKPIEVLVAKDAGGAPDRTFIKMLYRGVGGIDRTAVVEMGELAHFTTSGPLPGWMNPAGATKQNKVVDLWQTIIYDSSNPLPVRTGFTQCGWVRLEDPLTGRESLEHIRPGSPLFAGRARTGCTVKGSSAIHKAVLARMMETCGAFAFLSAIAAGSYMRGVAPETRHFEFSPIVQIHGIRSRGKTFIINSLATFQGPPGKEGGVVNDAKTTMAGSEHIFAQANHGFVCIDEGDEIADSKDGIELLMFYANRGGRGKSSRDQVAVKGLMWDLIFIISGNTRISVLAKGVKKEEALNSRTLELDIMDPEVGTFTVLSELSDYARLLAENHGHIYPEIIERLKDPETRERYLAEYQTTTDMLTTSHDLRHFQNERRLVHVLALAAAGAVILEDVVGPQGGDAAAAAVRILIDRYRNPDDKDTITSVDHSSYQKMEGLHSFIRANAGRFIWDGCAYTSKDGTEAEQKARAETLSYDASRAGALGRIVQQRVMRHPEDFEGVLYLFKKGENELKNNGGMSVQELTDAATRFGMLRTTDNRAGMKYGAPTAKRLGEQLADTVKSARILTIELRDIDLNAAVGKANLTFEQAGAASWIPTPAAAGSDVDENALDQEPLFNGVELRMEQEIADANEQAAAAAEAQLDARWIVGELAESAGVGSSEQARAVETPFVGEVAAVDTKKHGFASLADAMRKPRRL